MSFFLFLLLFSSLHAGLQAMDLPAPVADTLLLQGVEVRGNSTDRPVPGSMPAQSASSLRLQMTPGFSAAEMLRFFSGVSIKDYGGSSGLKTVSVRSLGAAHTGVFLDGMPLRDAASGQADLGRIPLDQLETISLYLVHPPFMLQTARQLASGSIISLQGSGMRKEPGSILRMGFRAGSFGTLEPSMRYSFSNQEELYGNIHASWHQSRGDFQFYSPVALSGQGSGERWRRSNADASMYNMGASLNWKASENWLFTMHSRFHKAEKGLPGPVIAYNPHSSQRLWNNDFSVLMQARHQPASIWQSLSSVHFSNSRLRYLDPDYHNTQGRLEQLYHHQEFMLSHAVAVAKDSRLGLMVSNDLIFESLGGNVYRGERPSRLNALQALALQWSENSLDMRLVLHASHLWEHKAAAEGSPVNQSSTSFLNPSLSMLWLVIPGENEVRIRASAARSMRLPSFNELYYSLTGYTGLKPERLKQFNLGLIFSHRAYPGREISLVADGWVNRVSDQIVAIPTRSLFVWSMRNLGRVHSHGIELRLQAAFELSQGRDLEWMLAGSLQEATDRSQPGTAAYGSRVPYIPRQQLSSQLFLQRYPVRLGLSSHYSGFRYLLPGNPSEHFLPAWWQHDLMLQWQFMAADSAIRLALEVNNLTNSYYEVIRGFPMPGRAFYLRLSWELSVLNTVFRQRS